MTAKISVEAVGAKIPIAPPMAITVADVGDLALFVAAGAAGQEHTPGTRRLVPQRRHRLKQLLGAGRRRVDGVPGRCRRVDGVPGLGVCLGEPLSAKVCPPEPWE